MLTLSRFMSKWYPNKSHSWRNHLGASTGRSLDFSLEVTSSSSHQSSCRWQQHPGSRWSRFRGCSSALTLFPALLCQAILLCRAEGLLKYQKRLPSLTPGMQKSLYYSLLTNYDWKICSGSQKVLSTVPFCLYTVRNAHPRWTPSFGWSVLWGKDCIF